MTRAFELPQDDVAFLDSSRYIWEAVVEGGVNWLIIRSYPIPFGYSVAKAELALRIPAHYADEQIDMVYFSPALSLTTNKPIPNLSALTIENKPYQQWSRHRTPSNPWRPGLDTIATHLLQVDSWLQRELQRHVA